MTVVRKTELGYLVCELHEPRHTRQEPCPGWNPLVPRAQDPLVPWMGEPELLSANARWTEAWSVRITPSVEFYPSLFPSPARQLAYLGSEFRAWSAL
jgi:hypothetical protein